MATKNKSSVVVKKQSLKQQQNAAEVAGAKKVLTSKSHEFNTHKTNAESNNKDATIAMLRQSEVVCEVATTYKQGKFNNAVCEFRANTGLESASKWSQFKRIGSVAASLIPYADRLPSGWSSLYVVASALVKNREKLTLKTLFATKVDREGVNETGEKVVKDTFSLNPYSTQSEVRAVVNTALGRAVKKQKNGLATSALVSHIELDALRVAEWDINALADAVSALKQQFPWVSGFEFTATKAARIQQEQFAENQSAKNAA